MIFELTKESNQILRGMAIMAIVMHNFCHFNGVLENEFTYSTDNLTDFWNSLDGGLGSVVWSVISFLGHYGVGIFVFLSGYGLAKKYSGELPAPAAYLRLKLKKIWSMLVPGLFVFALIAVAHTGNILHVAKQCFLTQFFLTHLHSSWLENIALGPYWYFGLALELYIFYYLVAHKATVRQLLLLASACLAAEYVVVLITGADSSLTGMVRVNIFGALPLFCIGVCMARRSFAVRRKTFHVFGATMLLASVALSLTPHHSAWLLSSLPWPFAAIWVMNILPALLRPALLYIGKISALIFVIHPIIRHLAVIATESRHVWGWWHLALYCIMTVVVAVSVRYVTVRLRRHTV